MKRALLSPQVLVVVLLLLLPWSKLAGADAPSAATLAGVVSSQEEGPMEGVVVSARRDGSTITVSVVSDHEGRYRFAADRLPEGHYTLRIRAVGYDLESPVNADVHAAKPTSLDLRLTKTKDLASQLSNAEWLLSMPGTPEQKAPIVGCVFCHSLERVVKSHLTAEEWKPVLRRMGSYAPGSQPSRPQKRVAVREPIGPAENAEGGDMEGGSEQTRMKREEYLATVNLSRSDHWPWPLKTLPRPRGRATRVVMTEYDLPRRDTLPHDVALDSQGTPWYADFGQQYIGKLNPKTGEVTEYVVPMLKPGFPTGMLDVVPDKEGNVWLAMMLQAGVARFDPKANNFTIWSLPKEMNTDVSQIAMVMPLNKDVDGKVWTNSVGIRGVHRLDLKTGKFEVFRPHAANPRAGGSVYGIASDSRNNLYIMDHFARIGRVDAKTGNITLYPTPTPLSAPRRGHMDSQDRLWFAERNALKIAMFDTRTQQFGEWAIPTPWSSPYDVQADKYGDVWSGGMYTDRIARLNPKTGDFTEYLLPRFTNIRRVFVDSSTNPPTFWVGNNHAASIIKLEPLD